MIVFGKNWANLSHVYKMNVITFLLKTNKTVLRTYISMYKIHFMHSLNESYELLSDKNDSF